MSKSEAVSEEVKSLKKQLKESNSRETQFANGFQALNGRYEKAKSRVGGLVLDNEELSEENQQLRQQLQSAQDQIQQLQKSTSSEK